MPSVKDSVAIGIDLGTTFCCVAYMNKNNIVDVIANNEGQRTTPSYVVLAEQGILVGKIAKEECFIPPSNVVYDSKRLIGRNFDDKYIQNDIKNWSFKVKDCENKPIIELSFEDEPVCYKPEEISAMLLGYMQKIAEGYIGKPVKDAIITVPAHFNYHQRTATVEAGKLAGLNVLGTINEPTAAALAYMHKNDITDSRTILVFDLGGGTFDVSIVKGNSNNMEVVATAGNTHLGGRDFDNSLIKLISKKILELYGEEVLNCQVTQRRIKQASENIKIKLSSVYSTHLDLQSFHNGQDVEFCISREEFEEINSEEFMLTIDIVKNCLIDAKLKKSDIDEIVLVGGSTRIPKIQELLSEFFDGKALSKAINADEAVAYGAAVQTAKFYNSDKTEVVPTNISDITPLSVGVDSYGSLMNVLIPRNTSIPATASTTFYTVMDRQRIIPWNIYEGERCLASENILLGRCILRTKPHPPGYEVDLIFDIDDNGILQVSARDESGNHTKLTIDYQKRAIRNVSDMIHDAEVHKSSDNKIKNVRNDWIHLKNYCTKLTAICNYDKFNISTEDKDNIKTITSLIAQWANLNEVAYGNDEEKTAIGDKLQEVDDVCEPLAVKYGFNVKHLDWKAFYELLKEED